MTVRVTDVRCPGCGKKLAEAAELTQGAITIKCPRCHKTVTIRV